MKIDFELSSSHFRHYAERDQKLKMKYIQRKGKEKNTKPKEQLILSGENLPGEKNPNL